MSPQVHNTVFISYRRLDGEDLAHRIKDALKSQGFQVFIDRDDIDGGEYWLEVIEAQIKARAHFLALITEGYIDKLKDKESIIFKEFMWARQYDRKIIPLAEDLSILLGHNISNVNAIEVNQTYFVDGFIPLLIRTLRKPIDVRIENEDLLGKINKSVVEYHINSNLTRDMQQLFESGVQAFKRQDYHSARKIYEKVLTLAPDLDIAYSNLSLTLMMQGEFQSAIEASEQALENNVQSDQIYMNYGGALLFSGEYDKALNAFTSAINLNRTDGVFYLNRGLVYLHQNKIELAKQDYEKSINLVPEHADSYLGLGAVFIRLDRRDEAFKIFNAGLTKLPQSVPLLVERGKIFGDRRHCDKALQDFTDAAQLQPERAEIHELVAAAYLCKDNYEMAEVNYSKAIDMGDTSGNAYIGRGFIQHERKNCEQAIEDFTEAIIRLPSIPPFVLMYRGHSYQMCGQLLKAIEDFTQAIQQFDPTDKGICLAYANRGEVYIEIGEYDAATSDFKQALDIRPADESALAGLAIIHHKQRDIDEAQRLWRMLTGANQNFSNMDWIRDNLHWRDALLDEAKKIIGSLATTDD